MKAAKIEIQDDGDRGRDTWTFPVGAETLAHQAKRWAAYHKDHEDYWAMQVETIEPKRRESATVSEQAMTGGVTQVLHFDPGLDREYNNATSKRDSHRSSRIAFEQWVACFTLPSGGTERTFHLTPSDVRFFGIGQEPPDDLPA